MKISDFLRMKITPDNKQFDSIKNIRFYDDKNSLLVGKGTTSVHAFCEAFFDYVYRNYSSARGAEKLVKSNRKKYTKFSGSESMILVQKILDEICDEYAITNYSITCEVDNGNAKKPIPAVQANEIQKKTVIQNSGEKAIAKQNVPEAAGNNISSLETTKLKTLSSQLERMQNSEKEASNEQVKPQTTDYSGLDDAYIHPVIKEKNADNAVNGKSGVSEDSNKTIQPANVQSKPGQEILYNAMGQIITDLDVDLDEKKNEVYTDKQDKDGNVNSSQQDKTIQNTAVQNTGNGNASESRNNYQNNSGSLQNNSGMPSQVRKDKKHGKKQQNIQDPRMKPGKGYKPFKPNENFKEAAKFQKADNNKKSNLNIDEIPCIAVKEEIIVPTMNEVPFIGIPEENDVPNISDVPFVGVEENVGGKDISEIPYVGVEDGEAGKIIPDVPYLGYEQGEAGRPIPDVPFIGEGNFYDPDDASEEQLARSAAYEAEAASTEEVSLQEKIAEHEIEQELQKNDFVDETAEEKAVYEDHASIPQTDKEPEPVENSIAQEVILSEITEQAAQDTTVKTVQIEQPAQIVNQVSKTASVTPQASQNAQSNKKLSPKPTAAKDIKKIIALSLLNYKQVVFTGPSATGKTYQVRKYARKNSKGYDGYKFVQFHPAFEYSDFIEGLRPVNIINTTNPTNVRLDGVFKAFCRRIVEDNLEHAVNGFSSLYAEKKQKVVQDLFEKIRDKKEAIEDGTETEDFPRDSQEYVFEHGVREYYFVIDEINRADIASVFGDVLFSLDEDYRGIENRFDTRLSNLKTYRIIQADDIGKANFSTSNIGYAEQMKFDCFEKGFFIPKNLHIIATMNELSGLSGDIDISFRQKFRWVKIIPSEIMKTSLREILKDRDIDWIDQFANNLNLVNNLISEGFSEEYCLGPAFFRKLDASPESIDKVFEMDIEPILKEYLKGKPDDISEMFIVQCRKALKMGI